MTKNIGISLIILAALIVSQCGGGEENAVPEYENNWPDVPAGLSQLEDYIRQKEDSLPVRADNHARIVWQDSVPQVTEYSFVYLHGFAGSYHDGYPLNVNVADTFGANIYLARWAGHGLKGTAAMQNFTPENAWESAKEALAIGHRIGEKVIVISTSTGGTLGITLAAEFPDSVHALINMAPNISDDQAGAFLLNTKIGPALAKAVSLGEYRKIYHHEREATYYWDTIYPAGALVHLQVLVESTMEEETFENVECPVLTIYYRKNLLQKDDHVEVSDYPDAHEAFCTPDSLKELIALDSPRSHFVGSGIKSADYKTPQEKIIRFCREKLGMDFAEEQRENE